MQADKHQEGLNFPTVQSIDAQSDGEPECKTVQVESLIIRILMLSIELDRKDMIIEDLMSEAHREQLKQSHLGIFSREMQLRYDKLEAENKGMIEANAILRTKVDSLQKIGSELDFHKKRGAFNQELEQKVGKLEKSLKQAEQQKIEAGQVIKKLKTQINMMAFNNNKNNTDKLRLRDLQAELANLTRKFNEELKNNSEQKMLIEKFSHEIFTLKGNAARTIDTYEEKINLIRENQELKASQFLAANDEKVVLLSQELNRLREEMESYRQQANDSTKALTQREQDLSKLHEDLKCYKIESENYRSSYEHLSAQIEKRGHEYNTNSQQLSRNYERVQKKNKEMENTLKSMEAELLRLTNKSEQLRLENESMYDEKNSLKSQLRKAKKKTSRECEVCKLKVSAAVTGSCPEIFDSLDFSELIQETERLRMSNSKVENLIQHHDLNSKHSSEIRQHASSYYSEAV